MILCRTCQHQQGGGSSDRQLLEAVRHIRQQVESLETRLAPQNANPMTGASAAESPELEAMKVAAAFQREIFRTDDGRLSGTDTQAGILIAAAVAVATFTGGLLRSGDVDVRGLLAAGGLAVVVTILALYARRERPKAIGGSAVRMESTGFEAAKKVGRMYDSVQDGSLKDPVTAARIEFDAWYALSASIKARRGVKTGWYLLAVVGLLLEVAAAIYTAASLTPLSA